MGYSAQTSGDWVDYVPTFTGFSADPGIVSSKYTIQGKICTVRWRQTAGTSNATTFTITLPFAAKSLTSDLNYAHIVAVDNNAVKSTPGLIVTRQNSNIADVYTNTASAAWTSSSTKFFSGTLIYEID